MDGVKGTILIVDDEESIRNVVSRRLKTEGYECVIAADGKDAGQFFEPVSDSLGGPVRFCAFSPRNRHILTIYGPARRLKITPVYP